MAKKLSKAIELLKVVLLAEDVDRNSLGQFRPQTIYPSSSSRRTWIEISQAESMTGSLAVVLLAEDVDRNCHL